MIIPFDISNNKYNERLLWYSNKQRYSTVTSVALINENLLVCASYYSRELYLVKFDIETETFDVLHTIDTTGDIEGKIPGPTDLIDYKLLDDGTHQLITSNFNQCSMSVYEITDNLTKLRFVKSIVNKQLGPCHGICYHPSRKDTVFVGISGSTNPRCGAYAINIGNSDPNPTPFFGIREPGWLCKDICFMNDINVFTLWCNSAPNPDIQRKYSTKVILYSIDLDERKYGKISEITIDQYHSDCIKYNSKSSQLYITLESANVDDVGEVMVFNVNTSTGEMVYVNSITGYNFPHGIDINYGMLAVSEYGNSDIVIDRVTDFPQSLQ